MYALLYAFYVLVFMAMVPYVLRFVKSKRSGFPVTTIFVAHWVETWTLRLQFERYQWLQKDPHATLMTWYEWTLFGFLSVCRFVSPMAYDVVDEFSIDGKRSQTWLVNFNIWHFIMPGSTSYIRWKMLQTIRAAKKLGVKLIGLGALLKDRGITFDGEYFANMLGINRPRLAHGDTLTAEVVYRQAVELADRKGTKSVFITGATSKIGQAVALKLVREGYTVYMHTDGLDRFLDIQSQAGEYGKNMIFAPDISMVERCALVITGKRTGGKELLKFARPGTVFLNFSVPDPLTPAMLEGRPFHHFDGGMLNYSGIVNSLTFAMRLIAGEVTYACHAWLLVCTIKGWVHEDELGKVEISKMEQFWQAAIDCGFKLPDWTSFLHPVSPPEAGVTPIRHSTPPPRRRNNTEKQAG